MKTIAAVLLLAAASARAAETVVPPLRACVKWSKEIPDAQAAGAGLFSSVTRVEGKAPFQGCDAVAETASFGVGWFMRAYMKENVLTACGKSLGSYSFHYSGDLWQAKMITGLHGFLAKHPQALAEIRACVPPVPPAPVPAAPVPAMAAPPAPAAVSSPAPVVQAPAGSPPAPLVPAPSKDPAGAPPTIISQPAVAPVHSSTETAPR